MEREVNEEKRKKFMEYAGKRVNNVLHDIQILEPMARSNSYDFTRKDVEDMFTAMQETLNDTKEEFYRKFDERARVEKKMFSFSGEAVTEEVSTNSSIKEVEEPVSIAADSEAYAASVTSDVENAASVGADDAVSAYGAASTDVDGTVAANGEILA